VTTSGPRNPNDLPAWQALEAHHASVAPVHLRTLFTDDPGRFRHFSLDACDLFLDYSKNRITRDTMALLVALAREARVEDWRERMFAGDIVNTTERRAALHVALRCPGGTAFPDARRDVMPEVEGARRRMGELSAALRAGSRLGHSGRPIESVVHIGIGGSHLGPQMAVEALASPRPPSGDAPLTLRFVSGIDAEGLRVALDGLDAETTLFIVVSKTFTTAETMANAGSAKDWLLERTGFPPAAVARHFVAITAEPGRAGDFGIPEDATLPIWDWVGGRFSICSAVGLPAAVAAGMDAFDEFLAGAHAMDRHFLEAPLDENMPVVLALLGVWYRNFFGAATRAVLPYDYRLRSLPAYLQQLEMESTGKRVGRGGEDLAIDTCPVVWGGSGNDAQHSFFQLLHQGGTLVPCDILVPAAGLPAVATHDDGLLANALAQAEALMRGRDADETRAHLEAAGLEGDALEARLPHCVFPGNQPSNTLLYAHLTPRRLGALVALYEHRLFVESVCWGVNAFDQWGVELGKELAQVITAELGGGAAAPHDPSTAGLLETARRLRGKS
jgi:glucose-6-phosphate isomerase